MLTFAAIQVRVFYNGHAKYRTYHMSFILFHWNTHHLCQGWDFIMWFYILKGIGRRELCSRPGQVFVLWSCIRHFILTVPLPTQEATGELSINPREQQLANLWWISITSRQSSSTISCFILWNLTGISCDNLGHSACVQKFTPQLLVDYHSVNVALAPWWWQCLIKLANFSFSLLAY